ncbi:MAG TPA: PAS domain-containing protein [Xanthobacteraceae bacterium]|nr:PAS domain-containing protein [Xanthobacteraceae bacterium]
MKHSSSRELFAHWNERRGARALPERGDIEPAAIRKSLGDTFILGTESAGDLRFRLAGTRVCALFGRELKDEAFAALWQSEHQSLMRRLIAIVAEEEIGVVAAARGRTPEGFCTDVELLLLPLRHRGWSGRRMLGALAPMAAPPWLGASRLEALALGSLRHLRPALEAAVPSRLAAAVDRAQPRHGFVVYDGGRS